MNWIFGLMAGVIVVLSVYAWVEHRMVVLLGMALPDACSTPDTRHSSVIAVSKFELMEEEQARTVLAGRNERDPLVCALLTILHGITADAALESNDKGNPEWLAQRCAGGLHWLLQFEAELKEALSAVPAEQKSGSSGQES